MSAVAKGVNRTAGLLAIDIGSSRVKLGWFPESESCTSESPVGQMPIVAPKLPQPEEVLELSHQAVPPDAMLLELHAWIERLSLKNIHAVLASVHPDTAAILVESLEYPITRLSCEELPLAVRVDEPSRVGIDRLLNAVAANQLRSHDQPAIVVDLGTACTVDLVAADGAFEGGAIFPGLSLSARSLNEGTSVLPQVDSQTMGASVEVVGKSTQEAIHSGLHWGMVGTVRELIMRMRKHCDTTPLVLVTGGTATQVVVYLASDDWNVRMVPHMVLSGICLAAEGLP